MTPSMHDDGDARLADWADDRMSDRDRERFEAEMRVNPALRERAERYRQTIETVQRALRQPVAKPDLADAVLARIQGSAAPVPSAAGGAAPWRGASRRSVYLSACAAAAVFVVLGLLIEWQPTTPSRQDLARAPQAPSAEPFQPADLDATLARGSQLGKEQGAGDVMRLAHDRAEQDDDARDAEPSPTPTAAAPKALGSRSRGAAPSRDPDTESASPGAVDKSMPAAEREGAAKPPLPTETADQEQVADDAGADAFEQQARQRLAMLLQQQTHLETAQTMLPQVRLVRRAVEAQTPAAGAPAAGAPAAPAAGAPATREAADDRPPPAGGEGLVGVKDELSMPANPGEQGHLALRADIGAARAYPVFFDRNVAGLGDLSALVPGTSVQVLPMVMPPVLQSVPVDNRIELSTDVAFLVEGTGTEVFQWLAQLSRRARSAGYDIQNSEVPTADVLTMVPAPWGQIAGVDPGSVPLFYAEGETAKKAERKDADDQQAAVRARTTAPGEGGNPPGAQPVAAPPAAVEPPRVRLVVVVQGVPGQGAPVQAPSAQAPSAQAPSAQAPSAQNPADRDRR